MEETILNGKIAIFTLVIRLFIDFIACAFLIGFVWLVKDLVKYFTTKLTITNKRLSGRTGLFNKNVLDSPLNKIDGIQVRQGLFGQIFNYGTISITTASRIYIFDYISNPNEFKNILNNQIEKYDYDRIERQAREIAEAMKY